jgi:hypothetical protein
MTAPAPCAAGTRGCGTPTGWRKGGRCPACRNAHNDDTQRRRGLTSEQRQQVLTALRNGVPYQEAAAAIGRKPGALTVIARRDPELAAALGTVPDSACDPERMVASALAGIPESKLGRQASYIAALITNGGDDRAATVTAGIHRNLPALWARTDPLFAQTEEAARRLGAGRVIAPHRHSRNRKPAAPVTAWGETKKITEWAKDPRCRTSAHLIGQRIAHGKPPEEAISTPTESPGQPTLVTAWGETKNLTRWAEDPRTAVSVRTLSERLRAGWEPEDALLVPTSRTRRKVRGLPRTP